MAPHLIEQEILIDAPVEVVWKVVTEPAQITQWFSDVAELDLRPGGDGVLTFEQEGATVRLQVEAVEEPHRFAFWWEYPDGEQPQADNALHVEFTLAAHGDGTRLRVVETGFDRLDRPEPDQTAYAENHVKGWATHLSRLLDHATGQS